MTLRIALALLVLPAAGGLAQPVRVFSEFQRIDPFGNVLAVDRAERPREILSPALARNAFASFQVSVEIPAARYTMFVAQNPEKAVDATVYREIYVNRNGRWIPDALEKIQLSATGAFPPVAPQAPGQTTLTFWVDLWVRRDAPVRRTRLEFQLNSGEDWTIYPLELRILTPVAPGPQGPLEVLPPVEAPASDAAAAVLRGFVCGAGPEGGEGALTIRRMIRRNARQDLALLRSLEPGYRHDGLAANLLDSFGGGSDTASWCKRGTARPELGAEWYLRARDYIYRMAGSRE